MKISLHKFSPCLFLILISWSCKKSDPTPVGPSSDLIAKTWKLTDLTINGVSSFSTIPSCTADDLFIFSKDGKYKHDEGATKCDPADPQIVETANWSFRQNLLIYGYPDGSSDAFVIMQLTTTTLKFNYSVVVGNDTVALVATYTAQ